MTYIDIHLLHTVPPSCVNRDDTGTPKTAKFGGVRRLRVSSQAWKRATRKYFDEHVEEALLGVRTLRIVDLVTENIRKLNIGLGEEEAQQLSAEVVKASGLTLENARNSERQESKYLILVSRKQAEALATLAVSRLNDAEGDLKAALASVKKDKKAAKAALTAHNSIDLALFGRMVADDADLNVDASCQVAHALSVHSAETEYDFFTAMDDLKLEAEPDADSRDAGAGMLGTVEFSSATLYRYASINVRDLIERLGGAELASKAIEAFIEGFTRSMPTGKINTFGNHTLPEGVVISLRNDQPMSFVGAFERPVVSEPGEGNSLKAAQAMAAWAEELQRLYGLGESQTWVTGLGETGSALRSLATEGGSGSLKELPQTVADAAVNAVPDLV